LKEKTDDHRGKKREKKGEKALGCACPHLSDGGGTPVPLIGRRKRRQSGRLTRRETLLKNSAEYGKNKFFGNFYIYY